jgi:hypothetical protein
MAALRIPDEHKPRLALLAELTNTQFDSLRDKLASAPPRLFAGELAESLHGQVEGLEHQAVKEIVGSLVSLYRARAVIDADLPAFLDDVNEAIETDPAFAALDKKLLGQRLGTLLGLEESLGVTSKAMDVATQHGRVYCDARILTDIRPVFSSEDHAPRDAVIVHTLKLGYHDSGAGSHKDFYIALDPIDLFTLAEVIKRAEEKERSICSMLKGANVRVLGLEEDE